MGILLAYLILAGIATAIIGAVAVVQFFRAAPPRVHAVDDEYEPTQEELDEAARQIAQWRAAGCKVRKVK